MTVDIPFDFLKCRGFRRHDWHPYTVEENPFTRVLRITEICKRCRCLCAQKLDSLTGETLTPRRISYVPGYRIKGGLPVADQNLARLEAYKVSIKVTRVGQDDPRTRR